MVVENVIAHSSKDYKRYPDIIFQKEIDNVSPLQLPCLFQFILVLSKMDAAYRQMRNEALLMLQYARLRAELAHAPSLLEAAPLAGEGAAELRQLLQDGVPTPPKAVVI